MKSSTSELGLYETSTCSKFSMSELPDMTSLQNRKIALFGAAVIQLTTS